MALKRASEPGMNMIADSADIRFACSQCGQHIVVEKSAAGLTANCPICDGLVTVPLASYDQEFLDRAVGEISEAGEPSNHGEAMSPLEEARKENERLRALFKKAVDECERVTANATHAQAEIKSFQSDRQQLKAELAQARQRATAAETQVAVLATALAAANHATQESAALREQSDHDLALSLERLSATENQLGIREHELVVLRAENSEVLQSLAGAQSELAATRIQLTGLQQQVAVNQEALSQAAETERQLGAAKQELETHLGEAVTRYEQLQIERNELHQVVEQLRGDLVGTESGRELLELRNRAANLTEEQSRTAASLGEKAAEVESLLGTAQDLRAQLEEARHLCREAERQATANSEAQLKKDNDVLRGIVERQNATLGVNFSELRRLRRARFATQAIYALFGLGLIALVFFALSIFSQREVGDLLKQLRP